MQNRPLWAVWPETENFPHVGIQEAMKTPPIQLDHLHMFGLKSVSTQSQKGGGYRYPFLGFTTKLLARSSLLPAWQSTCPILAN